MDRIQKQSSELWELLFDEETAKIYQAALNLTGKILTDTAQLLWLIICSVFVFGAWFSDASVKAGNNIRTWVDQQASSSGPAIAGESKPLSESGKDLLDNSRTAIVKLLNKAREELGLEAEPLPTTEKKAIPAAAPAPEAKPTASDASSAPASSAPAPTASPATLSSTPAAATPPKAAAPQSTAVSASSTGDFSDDTDDEDDLDEQTEDEAWPPQTADD